MTYSVYALRAKGDVEVRYIGLTNGDPQNRICNLRSCESGVAGMSAFGWWLDDNYASIQAVTLAQFETRVEGKAAEIAAIACALQTGQRLFNRDHVPSHLRISREWIWREIAA